MSLLEEYAHYPDKFVMFSGGRDSLVVLDLACKSWPDFKVIYIDTKISLPECNEYVKEICDSKGLELIILNPERDFWSLVKRWGFPGKWASGFPKRWCLRELKQKPLRKLMKRYGWDTALAWGIRRQESTQRMRSPYYQKKVMADRRLKVMVLYPILDWSDNDVLSYIHKNKLPVNPCYKIYGVNGNCYYCPFITKKSYYIRLRTNHPELFANIIEAEQAMRKGGSALARKGRRIYMQNIMQQTTLEKET